MELLQIVAVVVTLLVGLVAIVGLMMRPISNELRQLRVDMNEQNAQLRADMSEQDSRLRADMSQQDSRLRADLRALDGRMVALGRDLSSISEQLAVLTARLEQSGVLATSST